MDKKNKANKNADVAGNGEYDYYDIKNIASNTEFTGMIPTPPLTDAEAEGYEDLYPVPQQKAAVAKKADTATEQQRRSSVKGRKETVKPSR